MLTLEKARELLATTTTEPHLFLHAKNVMAAMGGFARYYGENVDHWMAIGYLHDYDYEQFPEEHLQEAMEYLAAFIACGDMTAAPAPKLLDWEQDAQIIAADVNKVAGVEVRAIPYLHWWTFLSYFRSIGEGQLLTLVSIREKLRTGKKLEQWEQEYYRKNPERVIMKTKYLAEEEAEFDELKELLGG